jgi:hypothetical protein
MSKISELSDGGSLVSSDYLIAVRSGGNVKVRMDQINVDQIDLGDNEFIRLGNSQDLTIVHDASNSIINQAGIGDLLIQKAGSTKLTVNSLGVDITGTATMDGLTVDGTPIRFVSTAPMLNFMESGVTDSNHRLRQNAGNFVIQTLSDDEGTATDRFFIDGGTGNVGINTSSPSEKLTIQSGNLNFMGGTNDAQYIKFGDTGDDDIGNIFYYHGNNNMVFTTNASEAMRIDASGNVGIGCTPNTRFHVSSATTTKSVVETTGTTSDALIEFTKGQGSAETWSMGIDNSNQKAFSLAYLSNGSPSLTTHGLLTVDTSGNVGIGCSPNVALEVDGGTANGSIARFHNANTRYLEISAESDGTYDDAISVFKKNTSVGQFAFRNSTTEYMRIDASGNLKVGYTGTGTPGNGNTDTGHLLKSDGRFFASSASNSQFNRNSDGDILTFRESGDLVGSIGVGSSDLLIGKADTQDCFLRFGTGGSAITLCDSSGLNSNDGLVDLGQSNYRFKDLYLSGVFESSGTANAHNYAKILAPTTGYDAEIWLGRTSTRKAIIRAEQISSNSEHDLVFFTNGPSADATEKARLDHDGNLLVGTTTASISATNNTGAVIVANGASQFSRDGGHTLDINRVQDGEIVRFRSAGNIEGSISISGSTTSYNTSSDQRLKDNIVDAPSASDDIDAIQVRSFDWKADGSHQKYGMVAQELQTVAPEAVSGDADSEEMMGVDYSKLVPMLVKEIQSLRARVAQLES